MNSKIHSSCHVIRNFKPINEWFLHLPTLNIALNDRLMVSLMVMFNGYVYITFQIYIYILFLNNKSDNFSTK